jgi:hypothetical protein
VSPTVPQDALSMLIEVAEAHPRFFRRQLSQVVDAALQVRAGLGMSLLIL